MVISLKVTKHDPLGFPHTTALESESETTHKSDPTAQEDAVEWEVSNAVRAAVVTPASQHTQRFSATGSSLWLPGKSREQKTKVGPQRKSLHLEPFGSEYENESQGAVGGLE